MSYKNNTKIERKQVKLNCPKVLTFIGEVIKVTLY